MDQQVTTSQISQFLKIIQKEKIELEFKKKELNFQISELDLIIKSLVSEFPNQFQKKIVPFGSFAFMKGSIVDEKEITVFLGDDWFVKVSVKQGAEILERRKHRISERVELIDDEINQLNAKIKTTEGLLTSNMLGKNEDGLDFFEIRETEDDELVKPTTATTTTTTSTQTPNENSKIQEISDDEVLSEEETIIPEGASVVKLKIFENEDNITKPDKPLTQEQIENKKYLDQIFANFGSDEVEDEDEFYDDNDNNDEEGEDDEDYMGYGLNNEEDDDNDYDDDDDEDDDDDFETYYKSLPAWAKKALNVTSPPSIPQKETKTNKKKKNVSFAPDVEEPSITVRKPSDMKHRIQQMLDQKTPNTKTIQTSQPKPNNTETMKLNVVERDVDEEEEEEDLEAYEQKKENSKEAREYVDRYRNKMNKFKFEHEYEEGIDRQLIKDNVQLSDNIELEANYDWQEKALTEAFDKQLKLDTENDGIFSSSTQSADTSSKPKKVSKFKLSRQQQN